MSYSGTPYLPYAAAPGFGAHQRRWAWPVMLGGLATLAVLLTLTVMTDQQHWSVLTAHAAVPHTGAFCASDPTFTKHTLKTAVDRPVTSLLQSGALAGERKFEASDVIKIDDYLYIVCDSSWAILRVHETMPYLSPDNVQIGQPQHDDAEDSGFEGIFHDKTSGDLYVVRESIQDEVDGKYRAHILKVQIDEPAQGAGSAPLDYTVLETCTSEFEFEGDSKGFEGATSIRGADGELYVLGLCEGNHCSESKGKDVGNGRIVVMKRADADGGGCVWQTVTTLSLPPEVAFVDYSALSIHHSTKAVAVTSQENSQLWIGSLSTASDGEFDPATAVFGKGTVYDFPRDGACELQYCNVEGIHWLEGGGEGVPQVLAAVSDKMKSKGRQGFGCLPKDQSVHLFTVP